ncbi:hypothetical protein KKB40_04740 [Patescibacteria group bacterium]|nr:hypothetical protein [Patescibacteria group bacterium]
MTQDKEHLDINLDFLDKAISSKGDVLAHKPSIPREKSVTKKYNWKKILIICGVSFFLAWIFVGWVIFSDNNSTSNTNIGNYTPPSVNQALSNNDMVMIGEYRCSRYNYDKAVALAPSESEQQINTDRNALEYRYNELVRLKKEIDSSYVNEDLSQYEINQYNAMVNEYNSKLASYKRDGISFDSRVDTYNAQIEARNNYLRNNCTLNR